jgi:hypothetical protein
MLASVLLFLTGPALAVDGVLEINQACAVQAGCFAGDAAGFPVTISASGSYRLTSDLSPPAAVSGIQGVSGTSHVTLDLNGFSLIGSASAPTGIAIGAGSDWEIRNGTVRGFVSTGISDNVSGGGHRVINVRATDNGGFGIVVIGPGSLIRDCHASANGVGLSTGPDGTVTGSTSENQVGDASSSHGIQVGQGSRVVGNVSNGNAGDGIRTGDDSVVLDNTVHGNGGFGLVLGGAGSGYARNSINDNSGGTVGVGVQEVGPNVCNGTTTCP